MLSEQHISPPSQTANSSANTSAVGDMVSQFPTEIAGPNTTDSVNRNSIRVDALITAMSNPSYTMQAVDTNNLSSEGRWINQLHRGLNFADLSSLGHRDILPWADQSIPHRGNVVNVDNIGRQLSSPSIFSPSGTTEALALLMQGVHTTADDAVSYAQQLQSIPPNLMINNQTLVPSQHMTANTISQDIFSRLLADQSTLAQLRSNMNTSILSNAPQTHEQNSQLSLETLMRVLSPGDTGRESTDDSQLQLQNHESRNLLPRNNDPQPHLRRDFMHQSLRNATSDGVYAAVIGNGNTNNNEDGIGILSGDHGGKNGDRASELLQQTMFVPLSTTSDLLMIAKNALDKYRSTS